MRIIPNETARKTGVPGPKPSPLDDPQAEEKRQLKNKRNREAYYRNIEKRQEYNREYKKKTRAEGITRSDRNYFLKAKYGLTLDDYEQMLANQNFRCASCGVPADGKRKLDVDHCHDTNVIRGLLCRQCNTAFGLLGDDADRVASLLAYALSHTNVLEGMH